MTERGRLDPSSRFFADDGSDKLVYAAAAVVDRVRERLGPLSEVVDAGDPVRMAELAEDLHARGVRRLMVEGGGAVHTQFLADDLVDELQLVVAPFFVGETGRPPVRRRGPLPVAPRPPGAAGRDPADRRRRAAALRAVRTAARTAR